MPGTRPTSYRVWQRRLQAANDRATAIARRAESAEQRDPDRVAFQTSLNRLTNWQRQRYLRYGTPEDAENVAYYAGLQRRVGLPQIDIGE
jgi:hypothetical protein